ncbi:two-component sensor histidine kinase [Nocardia nova]|uniref:histidine kinase n=1 Tax=Nocardia nova TaxID=37330 RepID=A0A2S6ANC6_9NOCA|nr:sensor histidine kinase [Nocardia nova]PPJ23358.1 two-component sensor histidine kinase [Nocardia nova]PPJ36728.1 two-component sensor histidine kinase [Nocardia nova]
MPDRVAPLRLPAWSQDLLLAVFITVMQVQGTVVRNSARPESVLRPLSDFGYLGYVLLITAGAVLVVRRQRPVAVFAVTALTSAVYYALDFPDGPGWLALFVAIYTVTAHGDGRHSLVVAGVGIAALTAVWLPAASDVEPPAAIGWVYFRIGAAVMSAALGESVRSRKYIAAQAVERAELAERTREEEARARVDAERLRIAREVHDTVAHAIAVINVQSGVTAHVLDKRPEQARETLKIIERTSSRALTEMRAILGVLRDDNDERAPHPGLAQLGELTAVARDAGLEVEFDTLPPPPEIPSAVGAAVYRIVQESITNVIRHAGPTRIAVELDYRAGEVEVRVTDEGRRPAAKTTGAVDLTTHLTTHETISGARTDGRGILGMRERCRLLGGDLDAGPLPHGGFAVTARLPLATRGTVPL